MKQHNPYDFCPACNTQFCQFFVAKDDFARRDTVEAALKPGGYSANWDPIVDIYRGNCVCGKWLVIPKTFTISRPLICGGSRDGGEKWCGREWFWVDSKNITHRLPEVEVAIVSVKRPSFEDIYMEFAHCLSLRSTCTRTQVGAVVISSDYQRVLSVGYNGGPRGVFNECLSEEPGKCGHLHAEVNALLKMDYNDPCKKIMMVTYNPCFNCSVAIINAKIDEVVYAKEYRLTDGIDLLRRGNVKVRKQGEVSVDKDGSAGVIR